jgi:hypothetical protein
MSSNSRAATVAAALLVTGGPTFAVEDLGALEVVGLRGQSSDLARRDRYECHNWAIEQTGATPLAAATQQVQESAQQQATADQVRRKRADRALLGAAIGAGIGSLIGHDHYDYDAENVIAGAAVGAAIGAVTVRKPREPEPQAEGPSDYLRALAACLEGRGYSVQMPTATNAPTSD